MLRHIREQYEHALFLAGYYRWQAARGFPLAGNDPLTGIPRQRHQTPLARAEARAVHKTQARFWLAHARYLRTRNP